MRFFRRWWGLWDLARRRLRSEEDYRLFQRYQGRWVLEGLARHGCVLAGRRVLDLGCGIGGYTLALEEAGAHGVALDLWIRPGFPAQSFFPIQGNALRLPFAEATFDGILCASLIEHVKDPLALLREIRRVTRPGGWVYLSFPPFYSPLGGHQFSPFHYLGERVALAMARWRRWWGDGEWIPSQYPIYPLSFAQAFGSYGLYPVTIRKARRWILQEGFQIVYQGVRFLPLNVSKIPILGEVLTWHVEFVIRP
ncbi:class I SAM-dependent methyltransferase [Thermoflexus sp.]|uniref:class I SAM-dependent methyltransferase n=1 Tax=Thermoflexus sp. TaxID=1969742 RepID=UPI0017561716|nr:class I SAM-dependent methyltransferase [Thermoflexus sp.]